MESTLLQGGNTTMPLGSVLQSPLHHNGGHQPPYLNPDGTPMGHPSGGYPASMSLEDAAAAAMSSGLSYQQ